MRRILLLAIVLAILFINTPEVQNPNDVDIFLAFTKSASNELSDLAIKEIERSILPVYVLSANRIQEKINETPAIITVGDKVVDTKQLTFAPKEKQVVNSNVDDMTLFSANSLTAAQWDAIVSEYNPDIQNTGIHAVNEGNRTGIDNAYVLAQWIHESTVGTAGIAAQTRSSGNIRCFGYKKCIDGFRAYDTWEEGLTQHFDLLRCYGKPGDIGCDGLWVSGMKKHDTYGDVIATWAPAEDNNNPDSYRATVLALVKGWREANKTVLATEEKIDENIQASFIPNGSPIKIVPTMTQGYGVGSHSPSEIWGGVDLIGSDEIYATMDGVFTQVPNSWPGGNCGVVANDRFRTLDCHMDRFAVENGVTVKRGDLIGYMGATGQVTGKHVHHEVREIVNGVEVNRDPNNYNVMGELK